MQLKCRLHVQPHPPHPPRPPHGKPTLQEIRAYLGFHILMGINCLPEIRDYWSMDQKLHYSPIASCIARNHFEISRYFHFVDNSALPSRDEPGYHRLQKVLPVISALRERFLCCFRSHPQNTIDEAMIPYKGMYIYACTCICNRM